MTASHPTALGVTKEWRCFHCDEVFTDREAAADHFGVQIDGCADDVACKLNAEQGLLVKMLREAHEELRKYHQEDNEAYRQFYVLGADHSTALRREEEKGYARGLHDARSSPEVLSGCAVRAAIQQSPVETSCDEWAEGLTHAALTLRSSHPQLAYWVALARDDFAKRSSAKARCRDGFSPPDKTCVLAEGHAGPHSFTVKTSCFGSGDPNAS